MGLQDCPQVIGRALIADRQRSGVQVYDLMMIAEDLLAARGALRRGFVVAFLRELDDCIHGVGSSRTSRSLGAFLGPYRFTSFSVSSSRVGAVSVVISRPALYTSAS